MRLRTTGRRLLVQNTRKSQFLTLISFTTPHPQVTFRSADANHSFGNSELFDMCFICSKRDFRCEVYRQNQSYYFLIYTDILANQSFIITTIQLSNAQNNILDNN